MGQDFQVSSLAGFAQELRLPIGLTLTEVELHTDQASFVDDKFGLMNPGRVSVRISSEHLAQFVSTQLPALMQGLKIELREGQIRASAAAKIVVDVHATVILKPVIVGGTELHLEVVDFEGPGVARGIMEKQLAAQNPVFKTADIPVPLRLTSVRVGEMLEVHGEWNLPVG